MSDSGLPGHLAAMHKRERRRTAARFKQFVAILTTTGYVLVAGGGWEPMLKGAKVGFVQALALVAGVAMLALSVYLAPEGETKDVGL